VVLPFLLVFHIGLLLCFSSVYYFPYFIRPFDPQNPFPESSFVIFYSLTINLSSGPLFGFLECRGPHKCFHELQMSDNGKLRQYTCKTTYPYDFSPLKAFQYFVTKAVFRYICQNTSFRRSFSISLLLPPSHASFSALSFHPTRRFTVRHEGTGKKSIVMCKSYSSELQFIMWESSQGDRRFSAHWRLRSLYYRFSLFWKETTWIVLSWLWFNRSINHLSLITDFEMT
jgi:hypothetical protein